MEITGKIITVLEPRGGVSQRTGNTWKSQEYVIETIEQYPKRCVFNVFGEDKINQYNIQVGQELTVSFDINAREWQGRWYNDIRAWNVQPAQAASAAPTAIPGDMPPFDEPAPVVQANIVSNVAASPASTPFEDNQRAAAPVANASIANNAPAADPFTSSAPQEGSTDNLPF